MHKDGADVGTCTIGVSPPPLAPFAPPSLAPAHPNHRVHHRVHARVWLGSMHAPRPPRGPPAPVHHLGTNDHDLDLRPVPPQGDVPLFTTSRLYSFCVYARLDPNSSVAAVNSSLRLQQLPSNTAAAASISVTHFADYISPNAVVITKEWKEQCLRDVQVGGDGVLCMRRYIPVCSGALAVMVGVRGRTAVSGIMKGPHKEPTS